MFQNTKHGHLLNSTVHKIKPGRSAKVDGPTKRGRAKLDGLTKSGRAKVDGLTKSGRAKVDGLQKWTV